MKTTINAITAAQRLDSRGKPTVQVCVTTKDGEFRAIVPSGASKGDYEAVELRDGKSDAYGGNSVLKAVSNVKDLLGPAIIERQFDVNDWKAIDEYMIQADGTCDKSNLGANAISGISMACTRAASAAKGIPLYQLLAEELGAVEDYKLPVPFFNVLNGGVHSGNTMAFQEFMIAPTGASSFAHAVQIGAEVYQELKTVIKEKFGPSAIGIGDEGGFAPPISEPYEALDLLQTAVERSGHDGQVKFGIDPASSEFYKDAKYDLGFKWDEKHALGMREMSDLYHTLIGKYPVVLSEDPFAQDDWEAWTAFNKDCQIELVGDDLLATNVGRMEQGNQKKACNALSSKINQIGSISESIAAAKKAYTYGWAVFVSHRSGETTDDYIADLVVGLRTGHLKSGAPCRGERVAKYNRSMDIEDEIWKRGKSGSYAGVDFNGLQKQKGQKGHLTQSSD